MAYWCDDQRLNLEKRRLDADQARALERMERDKIATALMKDRVAELRAKATDGEG